MSPTLRVTLTTLGATTLVYGLIVWLSTVQLLMGAMQGAWILRGSWTSHIITVLSLPTPITGFALLRYALKDGVRDHTHPTV